MAEERSWQSHVPRMLYQYLRHGERGLSDVQDSLHERAHRRPGGKFGKREASYLPFRPFPLVLWDNRCERCRFYREGEPGDPATCHIVGREGDRYGGEAIHPEGWCGFYVPPAGEPALAWLRERVRPTGKTDVRGEYNPPTTEKAEIRRAERRLGEGGAGRGERPAETDGAGRRAGDAPGEGGRE